MGTQFEDIEEHSQQSWTSGPQPGGTGNLPRPPAGGSGPTNNPVTPEYLMIMQEAGKMVDAAASLGYNLPFDRDVMIASQMLQNALH